MQNSNLQAPVIWATSSDGRIRFSVNRLLEFFDANQGDDLADDLQERCDRLSLLMVEMPEAFPDRVSARKMLEFFMAVRDTAKTIKMD